MAPISLPDYEAADLARQVETLPPELIDELPFGAIRVGADGHVTFFSRTEAQQSGLGTLATTGLDFFRHIAPCMNSPMVRGRIEAALNAGTLDVRLRHVGDFADRGRTVEVRAMSASEGGFWLFNRRV